MYVQCKNLSDRLISFKQLRKITYHTVWYVILVGNEGLIMFSSIKATKPSSRDELSKFEQVPFFRDALVSPISKPDLCAQQIQHAIFGYMPKWVHTLMKIRNSVVSKLGFKVGVDSMSSNNKDLQAGDKVGFMKIKSITPTEVICFAEDKHMDFYISVSKNNTQATISTLVNQKTLIGRLYVNAIIPFHYVIARAVIANALKAKRI